MILAHTKWIASMVADVLMLFMRICSIGTLQPLAISYNSNDISSFHNNEMESEVVDSRPTWCMCNLPIQKIYKNLSAHAKEKERCEGHDEQG